MKKLLKKITLKEVLITASLVMVLFAVTVTGYAAYNVMLTKRVETVFPGTQGQSTQTAVKGVNTTASNVNPDTAQLNADEKALINLVNKERVARGLNPLQVDMRIVVTARQKAQDMIDHHYFDHKSPNLGMPFDQFKRAGIDYGYAGENLAGAENVQNAHNALMNSPTHRDNILFKQYTHIGVGEIDGGPYGKMFVQHFISKW